MILLVVLTKVMVRQMEKSKFITAYLLRVDEQGQQYQGYMAEVENSLEAEQKLVGGYIQVIRLTDEIDCIINDDGKLQGYPSNRLWKSGNEIYDFIVGNIQCVRHDDEGNFISIQPEDIPIIEEALVPIVGMGEVDGNIVFTTQPSKFLPKWDGGDDGGC